MGHSYDAAMENEPLHSADWAAGVQHTVFTLENMCIISSILETVCSCALTSHTSQSISCISWVYSGGKKFLDTLKILHNLKYYHEIFEEKSFFVLKKSVTALDRHKQIQMISFWVYCLQEKLTKLYSWQFQYVSSQHCRYQSQQITENVFKTVQKINKPSHHQINI